MKSPGSFKMRGYGNLRKFSYKVVNRFDKVQLFWKGHKNVRNGPYGFEIYLVNVKTVRTIAHIFVAFSEKLNFNTYQAKNVKNFWLI